MKLGTVTNSQLETINQSAKTLWRLPSLRGSSIIPLRADSVILCLLAEFPLLHHWRSPTWHETLAKHLRADEDRYLLLHRSPKVRPLLNEKHGENQSGTFFFEPRSTALSAENTHQHWSDVEGGNEISLSSKFLRFRNTVEGGLVKGPRPICGSKLSKLFLRPGTPSREAQKAAQV